MTITFNDRDEYKRKSIAVKLEQLLDTSLDISPVVIDGNWGTGKTEFSLKLKNYLSEKKDERIVIYIDAFKEDHCEDPLLSITAAIANVLPEAEKEALIKKAIPAIKFGIKTALKSGAGWILRQEADKLAEEFQEAIKDASNAAIDGTIENLLSEHMEAENNIKALNDKLKELSAFKKIIVIIDELDRCRPTFAVQLIEKIKHIFEAPNVNFILVTNLSQLKAAINHVYGSSVDSQNYLDKFIKYVVRLPSTYKHDSYMSIHTSLAHWNKLVKGNELTEEVNNELGVHIEEIISIRQLSLREVETLHRYLEIYQSISSNDISNQKIFIYNLVKFMGIYLYCFGDKSDLNSLSATTIKKIAALLNIDRIKIDQEHPFHTPYYQLIFFGMIRDRINEFSEFLPLNKDDIETLKLVSMDLTKGRYSDFSYEKTILGAFEKFSLI